MLWGLIQKLDEEQIKKLADLVLDFFEEQFPDSKFVQWTCRAAREMFDVPDDDAGDAVGCDKDGCDCDE